MKNIIEICKDFGIEIPADKHADFLKAVAGEYKTNAEHKKVTDKLDAAIKRAETAEDALKGFCRYLQAAVHGYRGLLPATAGTCYAGIRQ